MTDALKELIKTAPTRRKGDFYRFMFISDGKYDGFWGVNGYDNIILLGQAANKTWYKIAAGVDVFQVMTKKLNCELVSVDIPTEYGVPRLFFDNAIHIEHDGTSAVLAFRD